MKLEVMVKIINQVFILNFKPFIITYLVLGSKHIYYKVIGNIGISHKIQSISRETSSSSNFTSQLLCFKF